jgi:hypothetical protein
MIQAKPSGAPAANPRQKEAKSPELSFRPAMFGSRASSSTVSRAMGLWVHCGMLYRIRGTLEARANSRKWAATAAWLTA